MDIMTKSSNGITMVPLNSKLLSSRKVFVEGEITDEKAIEFVKQIMLLVEDDAEKPISVFVNTSGGSVNAGMCIYDTIVSLDTPIRTVCLGKAFSMGAIIMTCAPEGSRYILNNSEIMVHEPLLGNRVGGNSSSIKSISDSLLESKEKLNNLLAKHTGKSIEEIDEATGYDHYFSAEQAVEFGLVDHICTMAEILKM